MGVFPKGGTYIASKNFPEDTGEFSCLILR